MPAQAIVVLTATVLGVVLSKTVNDTAGILIALGVGLSLLAGCFVLEHFLPGTVFRPRGSEGDRASRTSA
jgi:hypothetical protein